MRDIADTYNVHVATIYRFSTAEAKASLLFRCSPTPETGRRAHRHRQRAYRQRQAKACVTDQGSQSITPSRFVRSTGPPTCAVCGVHSHCNPFGPLPRRPRDRRASRRVGERPKNYVSRRSLTADLPEIAEPAASHLTDFAQRHAITAQTGALTHRRTPGRGWGEYPAIRAVHLAFEFRCSQPEPAKSQANRAGPSGRSPTAPWNSRPGGSQSARPPAWSADGTICGTTCTKPAEAGAPESTMLALMGHMSRRMIEHYSHIRMAAKRSAMDGVTLAPKPETAIGVPKEIPIVSRKALIQ